MQACLKPDKSQKALTCITFQQSQHPQTILENVGIVLQMVYYWTHKIRIFTFPPLLLIKKIYIFLYVLENPSIHLFSAGILEPSAKK